jgi:hypothetical protein
MLPTIVFQKRSITYTYNLLKKKSPSEFQNGAQHKIVTESITAKNIPHLPTSRPLIYGCKSDILHEYKDSTHLHKR